MLYIFNSELDSILTYECPPKFTPVLHYWDLSEPTLLCIQCEKEDDNTELKTNIPSVFAQADDDSNENVIISTLFCSTEYGVKLSDTIYPSKTVNSLLGICAPHIYFSNNIDLKNKNIQLVATKTMRDFVGFSEAEVLILLFY